MRFWCVVAALSLAVAGLVSAQVPAAPTGNGEISGRLSDISGSVLPGVTVTVAGPTEPRMTVTDGSGQFRIAALPFGPYQVTAELTGFRRASGAITLSPSLPRAFITWPLTIGCVTDSLRIKSSVRDSATRAEAIVHLRVDASRGQISLSSRPDCEGEVWQEYAVTVLESVRVRSPRNVKPVQVLFPLRAGTLRVGEEYLMLLMPDGRTEHEMVFPIVSGTVAAPDEDDLNGLRTDKALDLLVRWSRATARP